VTSRRHHFQNMATLTACYKTATLGLRFNQALAPLSYSSPFINNNNKFVNSEINICRMLVGLAQRWGTR